MHKEIERRWIVSDIFTKTQMAQEAEAIHVIIQGYLGVFSDMVLRIRLSRQTKNRATEQEEVKAVLTFKSLPLEQDASARWELEVPISAEDGYTLLNKCDSKLIYKTRYDIKVKGRLFEVDVFGSRYDGLRIAECEYDEQDSNIIVPDWCLEEITGKEQYSNYSLATTNWNLETLQNWDIIMQQVREGKHKGVSMGCSISTEEHHCDGSGGCEGNCHCHDHDEQPELPHFPKIRGLIPTFPNAVINDIFVVKKMTDDIGKGKIGIEARMKETLLREFLKKDKDND